MSLTAGVTDTLALKPDELLFLFALLILLSTAATQIRAYGPLGSLGDGQTSRMHAKVCMRVCMSVCSDIDSISHCGEMMVCRRVCAHTLVLYEDRIYFQAFQRTVSCFFPSFKPHWHSCILIITQMSADTVVSTEEGQRSTETCTLALDLFCCVYDSCRNAGLQDSEGRWL